MYRNRRGVEINIHNMSYELALDEQREEGVAEGITIGEERCLLKTIRNLMKKMNVTAQQAMEMLTVPDEEQQKYLEQL